MRNHRSIIFILVLVLCSVSVLADYSTDINHYYSVDTADIDGNNVKDLSGNNNGTQNGDNTADGILNEGMYCSNDDYIDVGNEPNLGATDYTICFWFNVTGTTLGIPFGNKDGDGNYHRMLYSVTWDSTPNFAIQENQAGTGCEVYTDVITGKNDGAFHHLCIIKNGSACSTDDHIFFIDGVKQGSTLRTDDGTLNDLTTGSNYRYGVAPDNSAGFVGNLDEFGMWERALTDTEVSNLYNSGTGYNPFGVAGGGSASITCTQNLTDYGNYTQDPLYFGLDCIGNVGATTDVWNISVYMNDTLNYTIKDVALNTSVYTLNLTYGKDQIGYNINVSVDHGYDPANYSDMALDIFIDSIPPELSISSDFINNSVYYKHLDSLDLTLTGSDLNLFAMNLSVFRLNGDGSINETKNNTFQDDINSTTYILNFTGNRSLNPLALGWELGSYMIRGEAWDSHTDNKVKPITWDLSDPDVIKIEDIEIQGSIKQDLTEFYLSSDRYKFKITWEEDSLNHELIITATGDLTFISNSGYSGHFVHFKSKRWIDFESNNIKDLVVTDLGDNRYKLNIELYSSSDEVEFESIGDLNYAVTEYLFTFSDPLYVYVKDHETLVNVSEFQATIFNSTISETKNSSEGVAYFNLSQGIYDINITSLNYIDYAGLNVNWSENITQIFYMNYTNAFKVYIRDQITNNLINDRLITLEFIGTNSSNYNTSTGSKFITDLAPDDYIIRYSAENYSTAFHYYTLVNGTNDIFTIYILPNSTSTEVQLYVYDENSNPVEDSTIIVYRYSSVLNSYVEVHNLRTDFEGKALLYVSLNAEFYKFFIYYNDVLKLQTQGAYITDTEITFNIILQAPILQDYYTKENVDGYVSYNTDTKNFRFWYNDPNSEISRGCLYLYQITASTETLFNSTCVDSDSALILLTAQNISGMSYLAKGYITLDGEESFFDSYSYTFASVSDYGAVGLFIVIFLTMVSGLIFIFSIRVGLVVMPLPILIGSLSFTNWIDLPMHYAIGLEVIFIIMAVSLKGK